jgi:hypothetical protein
MCQECVIQLVISELCEAFVELEQSFNFGLWSLD